MFDEEPRDVHEECRYEIHRLEHELGEFRQQLATEKDRAIRAEAKLKAIEAGEVLDWRCSHVETGADCVFVARLDQRAERAEARLGRIVEWSHQYGRALCPPEPDTYGEGVRDAKGQVLDLVTRAYPDEVEVPECNVRIVDHQLVILNRAGLTNVMAALYRYADELKASRVKWLVELAGEALEHTHFQHDPEITKRELYWKVLGDIYSADQEAE